MDCDDLEHGGPLADHHRLLVRAAPLVTLLQRAQLVDQLPNYTQLTVGGYMRTKNGFHFWEIPNSKLDLNLTASFAHQRAPNFGLPICLIGPT